MLSEQRRRQLDEIVLKMANQNAPQKDVQLVVDDFIKKFANEQTAKPEQAKVGIGDVLREIPSTVGNMGLGVLKGAASTVRGALNLSQQALEATSGKLADKAFTAMTGRQPVKQEFKNVPESWTTPTNTAQKVGKGIEQAAEFLIPGSASLKAGKAVKAAVGVGKLGGIAELATRALAEAGMTGGLAALQSGQVGKEAKTGALIGAAVPIAGKLATAPIKTAGSIMGKTGEKIWYSLIKPTKIDLEDGFNIVNIKKYNVGGTLNQMMEKTESKLSELTQQLRDKFSRTNAIIDLNDVAKKTAEIVEKNRSRMFGYNAAAKRALENIAQEIEGISANGLVDLAEAQAVKQGAGKLGSWVYGFMDRDAKATEIVYTKFYQTLKKEIEQKAPAGVREINKQLSELIPISHALIRRIPVANRNNLLGLTDILTLGLSGVEPRVFGLSVLNRLTKSGTFAKILTKIGEEIPEVIKPTSTIGKRIFGE